MVLLIVFYAALSMTFGFIEALMYHWRRGSTDGYGFNEHNLFTVQRVLTFAPIIYLSFTMGGTFTAIMFTLGSTLCFPFFHDGAYYLGRNIIDPDVYPDRWFSSSTTSTAKHSLPNPQRIVSLVIGALAFACSVLSVVG